MSPFLAVPSLWEPGDRPLPAVTVFAPPDADSAVTVQFDDPPTAADDRLKALLADLSAATATVAARTAQIARLDRDRAATTKTLAVKRAVLTGLEAHLARLDADGSARPSLTAGLRTQIEVLNLDIRLHQAMVDGLTAEAAKTAAERAGTAAVRAALIGEIGGWNATLAGLLRANPAADVVVTAAG